MTAPGSDMQTPSHYLDQRRWMRGRLNPALLIWHALKET